MFESIYDKLCRGSYPTPLFDGLKLNLAKDYLEQARQTAAKVPDPSRYYGIMAKKLAELVGANPAEAPTFHPLVVPSTSLLNLCMKERRYADNLLKKRFNHIDSNLLISNTEYERLHKKFLYEHKQMVSSIDRNYTRSLRLECSGLFDDYALKLERTAPLGQYVAFMIGLE